MAATGAARSKGTDIMEQNGQHVADGGRESPKQGGWGRWILIGGVAVLALGGIGMAGAMSNDFGGHGFGGHFSHMSMGGWGEHGLDNVLEQIDATPEQEKKLWAIIDAAHTEIRPVVRELRGT